MKKNLLSLAVLVLFAMPAHALTVTCKNCSTNLVQLLDRRSAPMTQEQQIQAARNILRQQKAQEALRKWESEVRAQAHIEMREAPR